MDAPFLLQSVVDELYLSQDLLDLSAPGESHVCSPWTPLTTRYPVFPCRIPLRHSISHRIGSSTASDGSSRITHKIVSGPP
jgi:hypothetical protein